METYQVVPATEAHARRMVKTLRFEDRSEWIAYSGQPTLPQLIEAVKRPHSYAALVDDEPVVLGGSFPHPEDQTVGIGWLAASYLALGHAYRLHFLLGKPFREADSRYKRIICYADKRNKVHHDWLAWLGFDLIGEIPWGPWSLPFLVFERIPNQCVSLP